MQDKQQPSNHTDPKSAEVEYVVLRTVVPLKLRVISVTHFSFGLDASKSQFKTFSDAFSGVDFLCLFGYLRKAEWMSKAFMIRWIRFFLIMLLLFSQITPAGNPADIGR